MSRERATGVLPASTRARILPAISTTLVFTVSKRPWRGPGAETSPSAAATAAERIQRLRYHRAFPSRIAEAVDHAVADEPVIALGVRVHRIGADAHILAVQRGGDRAGDRKLGKGQLGAHRRVDAGEEG